MIDQADMESNGSGEGSAPTQETQVPKWRLDEVLSRLRAREEELTMKDQLLTQFAPKNNQPQGMTPEELGLEPQTFQAVQKLAAHMANEHIRREANPIKHQMASVMNKLEETEFLMKYGQDKDKYLEQIKAQRQRHFQTTGSYMGVEDAYKLVMFDKLTKATSAPKAPAAQQSSVTTPVVDQGGMGGPDANQTRQAGLSAAGGQSKSFDQMTSEEQESYIDAQLSGGMI